jgi:hypothetical protein
MEKFTDEEAILRRAFLPEVRRYKPADGLGDTVRQYLKGRQREFKKNALVVDVWRDLIPAGLSEHCAVSGLTGGILYVSVTPGPYMHELRLMSEELTEELGRHCGTGCVKRIVLQPRRQEATEPEESI